MFEIFLEDYQVSSKPTYQGAIESAQLFSGAYKNVKVRVLDSETKMLVCELFNGTVTYELK